MYDYETQSLLLSYAISDPAAFAISQRIINPDYFDTRLRAAVRFILSHSNEYRAIPTPDQIRVSTKLDIARFGETDITPQNTEWYLNEIEKFCKKKAFENVILRGAELIDSDDEGMIEEMVKEAATISLNRDLGLSYFDDPLARLERMRDHSNALATGWKALDHKLYGGLPKGGLNIFAGGSGSGKSLVLQNLALNWAFAGKKVVYITLELSVELVAQRLDAMVANCSTTDVMRNMKDAAMKVVMAGKKAENLRINKMPQGTTSNSIRAYLKDYEITNGYKPDCLLVDYLDLLASNNKKVNVNDVSIKDKYVSEELRSLMDDFGMWGATASQLNRSSVAESEFDHSHIAGGLTKINTADNLFGIMASAQTKAQGEFGLQLMKTRTSASVGQKLNLKYDPVTMRITDMDGELDLAKPKSTSEMRDEIKAKVSTRSDVKEQPSTPSPEPKKNDIMALMKNMKRNDRV